ncbi:transposase [Chromobacterium haemolyticum]|uniref:Transposase n=1 Tax=Chromobacterium fluminis TaxID=3044269 RepID=A0ABX0LDQ0_9NEIS|nr:transposase [Chromobacterium haemolyticum]
MPQLIRPSKPVENTFIENFNGHSREELKPVFHNWPGARQTIEAWRPSYNHACPHNALNYPTLVEFREKSLTPTKLDRHLIGNIQTVERQSLWNQFFSI